MSEEKTLKIGLEVTTRRTSKDPAVWWPALAAICVMVAALWLLFSFRRAAWEDAWIFYQSSLQGVSLAPLANSRPINWLPWMVGYWLSPTSFIGMNLLMAWFMLLKGVLVYAIVRRLAPTAVGLALATALLSIVYPSEVGFFNNSYLNLHQGSASYLLAVFFLLSFWRRRSLWLLLLSIAALAFSLITYEAVLAVAIATPILLIWLEGRPTKRIFRVGAIWLIPVGIYLLYVFALQLSPSGLHTRESGLLTTGLQTPNLPLVLVEANVWNLVQQYVTAWQNALSLSPFNGSSLLFRLAGVTGVIACAVFGLHIWAQNRAGPIQARRPWPGRRWLGLFAISVLWAMLGYAVFSLASVRYDGWRLNFYTVFGASLTTALVLYALAFYLGRARWVISVLFLILAVLLIVNHQPTGLALLAFVAALGFAVRRPYNMAILLYVVLTIAMVRQLDLHRWLTSESLDVQELVTKVVLASPGVDAETPIVLVLDGNEWGDDLPISTSLLFDSAIDLIYGDPSYIGRICVLNVQNWGWHKENCSFIPAGVLMEYAGATETFTYASTILISARPDGDVRRVDAIPAAWGAPAGSSYDPGNLLNRDVPPPSGLETWFNPRPLADR